MAYLPIYIFGMCRHIDMKIIVCIEHLQNGRKVHHSGFRVHVPEWHLYTWDDDLHGYCETRCYAIYILATLCLRWLTKSHYLIILLCENAKKDKQRTHKHGAHLLYIQYSYENCIGNVSQFLSFHDKEGFAKMTIVWYNLHPTTCYTCFLRFTDVLNSHSSKLSCSVLVRTGKKREGVKEYVLRIPWPMRVLKGD